MGLYLSLKDHVYNFIQEKINDGTLKPNEKINEQMIYETLQVSRTPVREALIQLSTEGYLEKLPRRGFIVRPIDEKKAKELYITIGTLDGLAANLAIDFITTKEIEKMKQIIYDIDIAIRENDFKYYYDLQKKFHDIYIEICNNEELIRILNQLRRSFIKQPYNKETNTDNITKVLKETNNEHKTIVELFEKKDKEEIEKYIRYTHWNISLAKFEEL